MDRGNVPNDERDSEAALPPTREFLQRIEAQAAQLRYRAGVGPLDRLDPRQVADRLDLTIATPDDIQAMAPDERANVEAMSPKIWSGSGLPLPDGHLLVLLNPSQTPERANVTVLEEAAHDHLGHEPTSIDTSTSGVPKRTYNARNEQEAYWTAAAALLPSKAVALAVYKEQSACDLAAAYGVSVELAEFRIKITGLWRHYAKYAAHKGV